MKNVSLRAASFFHSMMENARRMLQFLYDALVEIASPHCIFSCKSFLTLISRSYFFSGGKCCLLVCTTPLRACRLYWLIQHFNSSVCLGAKEQLVFSCGYLPRFLADRSSYLGSFFLCAGSSGPSMFILNAPRRRRNEYSIFMCSPKRITSHS